MEFAGDLAKKEDGRGGQSQIRVSDGNWNIRGRDNLRSNSEEFF
jgi:hypothetical protein